VREEPHVLVVSPHILLGDVHNDGEEDLKSNAHCEEGGGHDGEILHNARKYAIGVVGSIDNLVSTRNIIIPID